MSSGDPAVDKNAVAVDGHLDPHERERVVAHGGGDDALGDGVGEAVGVAGGDVFGVFGHGGGSSVS